MSPGGIEEFSGAGDEALETGGERSWNVSADSAVGSTFTTCASGTLSLPSSSSGDVSAPSSRPVFREVESGAAACEGLK